MKQLIELEDLCRVEKIAPESMVVGQPYILGYLGFDLIINGQTLYLTGKFVSYNEPSVRFNYLSPYYDNVNHIEPYNKSQWSFYKYNTDKLLMEKAKQRSNKIRNELMEKLEIA